MISVLLGCPDTPQLESFASILSSLDDIRITGSAATLEELAALSCSRDSDLILLAFFPDLHTGRARASLSALCSRHRILAILPCENPLLLNHIISSGITGFISSSSALSELVDSIRAVARGKRVVGMDFPIQAILSAQPETPATAAEPVVAENRLTSREKSVLSLLSDGLSNKEIAGKLHLSVRTIEMHLHNSYAKLQVQSRLQAVVKYRCLAGK